MNQGGGDTNGTDVLNAAEDTAPEETTIPAPDIAAIDGGGADFTIIGREGVAGDLSFSYHEILAEEMNGDTINDAVYKRNSYIEEKYNINIIALEDTAANVQDKAAKAIQAGDASYDIIMPMTTRAFSMSTQGLFYNVEDIPYVDTDKPWWQSRMMDNFSIGGANFFLIGDTNFSNFNASAAMFYNKAIAEDYDITGIYDTVREGKWTLDVMHTYCKKVTHEVNGDAIMNGDDAYGFVGSNFAWQPMYYGCGSRIIDKDEDDLPYLTWDSEKNINIITKITQLLNDESATLLVNQFPELNNVVFGSNKGYGAANIKTFVEDRALLWAECMYGIFQLRDMESDFGVIPVPKYDEAQDAYTSFVHANHSSSTCVPVTNRKLELTGAIIEDMAYQSYVEVRPAFYETTLKGKLARDEDTVEMLDIIYENINADLTLAMYFSGLNIDNVMRSIFTEDRSDVVSLIQSNKSANEAKIQTNVDAMLELIK